ncbi:MAG TPA: hypothetical protein VGQ22_10585 [Steroidobacteraceae bacterium]|jgi:hypothetical protein|nr:hypothetical protein [Steroidobacteraceae bacterium]
MATETRTRFFRPIVLAAALALSACASQAPQRGTSASAATRTLSGNADELAGDALQELTESDAQTALAAIARANLVAQNRPDLAWLHVRICALTPGCEPEPIEARFRKLAPDNGVVWLGPLARAQSRRDKQVEAQILEAMSRAQRFDVYWTTLIWRLSAARRAKAPAAGASPAPLTEALDRTTEVLSAAVVPAFKPLSTACELARTQDPTARTRCDRIALAMQSSDTTLVEGLGIGMAQHLATPASPEAIVLDERAATLSYRSQAAGAVVRSQVERDKFSAQLIELMKKLPREQDVSVAILRWAGEPLLPGK